MFRGSTKKFIKILKNVQVTSIILTLVNFVQHFLEKWSFLAKNSIKWIKNGQLTLEMALMKDDTCVLSIMGQKLDESANKLSKNGSKVFIPLTKVSS